MGLSSFDRLSRRAALRGWLSTAAPLLLLTACGGGASPTSAPTSKPAAAASPPTAPAANPAAPPAASPVASPATSPIAAAGCVLTPQQTEGPYYIETGLIRSDITEGKPGVPLTLALTVQRVNTCEPIPNATVEIWHCDALGDYSGFASDQVQAQSEPPGSTSAAPAPKPAASGSPASKGPGGPPGGGQQTVNELRFMRGGQVSGSDGRVTFQTIYPGWYRGRTVHIHVKVHVADQEVHTGQLYFDDAVSDSIFTQQPYASHPNRDTTNARDGIFAQGGAQSLINLTRTGNGLNGTQSLVVQV